MDERPLVEGRIANFDISLDVLEFFVFLMIFLFLFIYFFFFLVFFVHPTVVSVLLSASVEKCFVSCMRDFAKRFISAGYETTLVVCSDAKSINFN